MNGLIIVILLTICLTIVQSQPIGSPDDSNIPPLNGVQEEMAGKLHVPELIKRIRKAIPEKPCLNLGSLGCYNKQLIGAFRDYEYFRNGTSPGK